MMLTLSTADKFALNTNGRVCCCYFDPLYPEHTRRQALGSFPISWRLPTLLFNGNFTPAIFITLISNVIPRRHSINQLSNGILLCELASFRVPYLL